MVVETLDAGNKLLFCGNGGSAADAQHLAAEYVIRYRRRRGSLPAMALSTDTSALTAAGNDFGFDHVFARQIEGVGAPGDLLVLHSTSGASQNLIEAARVARERGVKTVALLARDGGALKSEVDLAIVIPTDSTARAQEMHIAIGHAVAEWVDRIWSSDES
jgi:D-sedoheptulose 7-phosphate isomerase